MLVVRVDSEYVKKATGRTNVICEDGERLKSTIEESIVTGEPKIFRARSVGKNQQGEVVAEFFVTWSFKVKNKKSI